ncbi:hypothetical protein [Niallia nealsonii]|uniref:Type 4 fimbrial biogenesis protein PilX N-terminal domain-containing protein n=1 Tax=Niallia nealsonii TaxID=115979 RepID=A0A2N0YWP2_9BACI|nr:hypothetical protein [Niallia nealsonii]PKG21679.1 hypothetical protein CWS01_21150 [Niallia nealsonii]
MLYKSEKGNALIIVLIMVTVFFILYISIMGMTFNNSKQIMVTEDKVQAVSIAEMGVTYYKTAIINESAALEKDETFKKSINQLIDSTIYTKYGTITAANKETIEKEMNSTNYFSDLKEATAAAYRKKLQSNLEEWNNNFFKTLIVSVDNSSKQLFSIANIKQSNTKDSIIYSFDSIGKTADKTVTLNSSLTIPITLDPIILEVANEEEENDSGNSGGTGNSGNYSDIYQTGLTGNEISNPGNLNSCVNPIPNNYSFSNSKCQYSGTTSITTNTNINDYILKVNGALILSSNINSFNRSTLYSTGDLTVNGNLNGNSTIKIHSGGSISFSSLNDTVSNSIIESAGNGTFQNLKTANSSIYIGGTVKINNLNSFKNSKLEVKGNLETENWSETSDSIISIAGTATFKNLNSTFTNTNMMIKGSGTFQNLNSLTNSTIRIGGASTFSEINQLNSSKIIVNGDASIQGLNNPNNNSKLLILGNATINKINNITNSAIYIGSNAAIGNLNLGSNAKICVRETLDITGNFNKNGDGKVFAKKVTTNTKNKYGQYIDTSSTSFQTNCTDGYTEDNGSNSGNENNQIYLPIINSTIESEKSELDAEYDY